jgi:site-specific DNA recombinase
MNNLNVAEPIKRVVIYIRVSTQEQIEGYSIDNQKEKLIAYCKARGWQIVEIIVDPGFSGAKLDRPGMQKLIANVTNYDIVLVYKLDRLSRSQRDTMYLIEDVFLPNNVNFVSVSESFDTTTPFGRAMVGILSVFAQLERDTIKERTHGGRIKRAQEGLFHGGGNTPTGYQYVDGNLVPHPTDAERVRAAFKLYNEGNSFDRVSAMLHLSGAANVRHMLMNDVYIGKVKFQGETYDGQHEPLISEELFNRTQKLIERRAKTGCFSRKYLLSGFLYCGNCGARYHGKTVTFNLKKGLSTSSYYRCGSRNNATASYVKDPTCKNRNIKIAELESYVDYKIRTLIFDPAELKRIANTAPDETQTIDTRNVLQKQIDEIDRKISKLLDLYQNDMIPVSSLNEKIAALTKERDALVSELEKTPSKPEKTKIDDIIPLLENTAMLWDHADDEQKRELLSALVDSIVIYDDRIDINWSFI